MPALLLAALALLAADPVRANGDFAAELVDQINIARIANGVLPVTRNVLLDEAAGHEAGWTTWALKHEPESLSFHHTSTAWLLDHEPDLAWWKLLATYGGILPEQLGSFDVARLCGYSGLCSDNISVAARKPSDAVTGWLRSPSHRANLLDERWTEVGTAKAGGGQDAIAVAVFGKPFEE